MRLQRVAQSAKLPNIKGSYTQREHMAMSASKKLFGWASDIFEKKTKLGNDAEITTDEMISYFEESYPNLYLGIGVEQNKKNRASLLHISEEGIFKYFAMNLNFTNNAKGEYVISSENINPFIHEHRHLCDFIYNPKFLAKESIFNSVFNKKLKTANLFENFYENHLYANEIEDIKTPLTKEQRIKAIYEKTKNILDLAETPEEKIAVLQYWRYSLKTEINAYKDGVYYQNKQAIKNNQSKFDNGRQVVAYIRDELYFDSRKIDVADKYKKLKKFFSDATDITIDSQINKKLFLPEKLKILESMLGQEIVNARKIHKENLIKNPLE